MKADKYVPSRSLYAKINRRMTQFRQAAPARLKLEKPILSITFDDCPQSAILKGAEVLNRHHVKGGFYIATGLIGRSSVMGRMASAAQIKELAEMGHEIGAHSHAHFDYARAEIERIEADIQTNIDRLREICALDHIDSFAFPYGETSFQTKKKLSTKFSTLRGLLPGINRGQVDRAQLRSYELDGCPQSAPNVLRQLDELAKSPGWMIVFSHDVSDQPSSLGTTPEILEQIISKAQALGIDILPPSEAAQKAGLKV